jgi:bacteriocin-like protein
MRVLSAEELKQVSGGKKPCGGKSKGNNGYGNGGGDGVPGNSGKQDCTR